jgi:cytidine deaminase
MTPDATEIRELIEAARGVLGVMSLRRPSLRAGHVAAAVRTAGSSIYTGICLDLSCGVGFCAEHAAVAEMLKHRETRIAAIVALDATRILPPCGRCRELLLQVDADNGGAAVILAEDRTVLLRELLPEYWDPAP